MNFCVKCGQPLTETQEQEQRYCPQCGKGIEEGINFCRSCGTNLTTPTQPSQYVSPPAFQPQYAPKPPKSPGLAAVLNFLIWGVGYLYIGEVRIGVAWLVVEVIISVLMWVVPVIPWVVAILIMSIVLAYDAYNRATKMQKRGSQNKDQK